MSEPCELDRAWGEAEAALPEGWRGPVLRRSSVVEGQYQAQAFDSDDADAYEYADTPAAALLALAARLREVGGGSGEAGRR